jgi:hypothetical protein
MIDNDTLAGWSADIRQIFADNPQKAFENISLYVKAQTAGHPAHEGRAALEQLLDRFAPAEDNAAVHTDSASTLSDDKHMILARLLSQLLGRPIDPAEMHSGEALERLAQSLNTIFDALNRLIGVINTTFSGESSGEQTIRQFIGGHLEGGDQTQSLEVHLGRINEAFLVTQEAFKQAARSKVEQILQSIDTGQLAERSGMLKIGPLRRAEQFDVLKEKIDRIKRWFDSGRFMEDYLREFEKNCRSLLQK